jgi:hypothetical protein
MEQTARFLHTQSQLVVHPAHLLHFSGTFCGIIASGKTMALSEIDQLSDGVLRLDTQAVRRKLAKLHGVIPDEAWDRVLNTILGDGFIDCGYDTPEDALIDYADEMYSSEVAAWVSRPPAPARGRGRYPVCQRRRISVFEEIEHIRSILHLIWVSEKCGCSVRPQVVQDWNRRHPDHPIVSVSSLERMVIGPGKRSDYLWSEIAAFWNLAHTGEELEPDALRRKYQRGRMEYITRRQQEYDEAMKAEHQGSGREYLNSEIVYPSDALRLPDYPNDRVAIVGRLKRADGTERSIIGPQFLHPCRKRGRPPTDIEE